MDNEKFGWLIESHTASHTCEDYGKCLHGTGRSIENATTDVSCAL